MDIGASGTKLPSRTWGPSEIFSCAGRSTFFLGGMLLVSLCVGLDSLIDHEENREANRTCKAGGMSAQCGLRLV